MRILTFALCLLCFSVSAQIDWDFPYNPDADNDGYIYSEDLLDLLAIYGQEYSSDELYLSQDSSSLIVNVGDYRAIECLSVCNNLDGKWEVMSNRDIVTHYSQLSMDEVLSCDDAMDSGDIIWARNQFKNSGQEEWVSDINCRLSLMNRHPSLCGGCGINPSFTTCNVASVNPSTYGQCWCVTQQRPTVEYMHIQNLTEEEVNVLSSQGWRHTNANFGSNSDYMYTGTMWRWAE